MPTLLFSDDFNRADTSGGTMGNGWVVASTQMKITSNAAATAGGSGSPVQHAAYQPTTVRGTRLVAITPAIVLGQGGQPATTRMDFLARFDPADKCCYLFELWFGAQRFMTLYRCIDGVQKVGTTGAQIGDSTMPADATPTQYIITFNVLDGPGVGETSLSVSIAKLATPGTPVASATAQDTTTVLQRTGYAGLSCDSPTAHGIADNLEVWDLGSDAPDPGTIGIGIPNYLNGLGGYYKFKNHTYDHSGSFRHLTGTSPTYGVGKIEFGLNGGSAARQFNEINWQQAWTLAAWLETNTVSGGDNGAIGIGLIPSSSLSAATTRGSLIETDNVTTHSLVLRRGDLASASVIAPGEHHICLVYVPATGLQLYVDGVASASINGTVTTDNATGALIVGQFGANPDTFSEVMVYPRALPQDEITALANASRMAYYSLAGIDGVNHKITSLSSATGGTAPLSYSWFKSRTLVSLYDAGNLIAGETNRWLEVEAPDAEAWCVGRRTTDSFGTPHTADSAILRIQRGYPTYHICEIGDSTTEVTGGEPAATLNTILPQLVGPRTVTVHRAAKAGAYLCDETDRTEKYYVLQPRFPTSYYNEALTGIAATLLINDCNVASIRLGINDTSGTISSNAHFGEELDLLIDDLLLLGIRYVILHASVYCHFPSDQVSSDKTAALDGYRAVLLSRVDNSTVFAGDFDSWLYYADHPEEQPGGVHPTQASTAGPMAHLEAASLIRAFNNIEGRMTPTPAEIAAAMWAYPDRTLT